MFECLRVLVDNRGFMTANGQPDQSRSARYVLKDYVCGKLLYCHAPLGVEQAQFHTFPDRKRPEILEEKLPQQQQRALRVSIYYIIFVGNILMGLVLRGY